MRGTEMEMRHLSGFIWNRDVFLKALLTSAWWWILMASAQLPPHTHPHPRGGVTKRSPPRCCYSSSVSPTMEHAGPWNQFPDLWMRQWGKGATDKARTGTRLGGHPSVCVGWWQGRAELSGHFGGVEGRLMNNRYHFPLASLCFAHGRCVTNIY